MSLRLLPCLCMAACAGSLPSGDVPVDSATASSAADSSVSSGISGGSAQAAPMPALEHSLDERVVIWVDRLQEQRGRRGLKALSAGGGLEAELRHARARSVLGHTVESEQLFHGLVAAYPDCAAAHLGLARVLMSYGRYAAAAESLRAVRQLEVDGRAPRSADTGWMLGACLLQGDEARAGDRILRSELVDGPGFGSAALVLANDYAGREALIDALAIIDAARARGPERRDLFLARMRLLGDLWQHREALVELRDWLSQYPDDSRVREVLVGSLRSAGDSSAALAELGRLILPAGEGDVTRQLELGHLADEIEIERRGGARRYSEAELLAILRGGEDPALRLRAFEALMAARESRGRAVFVAWQQDHTELRIAVVRSCQPGKEGVTELLRDALADQSPLVRGAAATRCGDLDKLEGIPLLTAALAVEEDPYTFRCVHQALQRHYGSVVYLPHGEEGKASGRSRTLEAWRQIWNR